MKKRLLDLFCGPGGAAIGYARAGFEVTGVDIKPQPHYPFEFVQADALEILDGGPALGRMPRLPQQFDAIHASPPCQHYSAITIISGRREDHPDLIGPTRDRLLALGLPYVIENVERARKWLVDPARLCATSFGLGIDEDDRRFVLRRHRLFETNWMLLVPPCAHDRRGGTVLGIYGGGTSQATRVRKNTRGGNTNKANSRQAQALMEMPGYTREELNQAIPPVFTEFIGKQFINALPSVPSSHDAYGYVA